MNIVQEETAVGPNDVDTLPATVHCDSSIIGHCAAPKSSTIQQSATIAAVALSGDMETVTETVAIETTTSTTTTTTAAANAAISETILTTATIIPPSTTTATASIAGDSAAATAAVNVCNLEKNNLPEGVRVLRNVASNVETISDSISTSEDIKKLKHVQGRSNSTGRLYNSSRRVSFPENDSELVTGYLEPADPWACGMYTHKRVINNKMKRKKIKCGNVIAYALAISIPPNVALTRSN